MKVFRGLGAALLAALAMSWPVASHSAAKVQAPAEGDQPCLGCHGQEGLTKNFEKGGTLSLHVKGEQFAKSVHAPLGCAACHADVDLAKHPAESRSFATPRAFSVAAVEACKGCHDESFQANARSVHGHGVAKDGGLQPPLCVDCHSAHEVMRASIGTELRDTCLGCHADAVDAHAKWLPNTRKHFDIVSCAACHAPGAEKRVDLRLYDPVGKREYTGTNGHLKQLNARTVDGKDGKPLDPGAMHDLLEKINGKGLARENVTLVGRLEASVGADAHALLPGKQAVKDCGTCHRKGAPAFQNVTFSVIDEDGKRVRYEARSDVLHAPQSVESVREFYAMGGTRIGILDVLLALALLGGISAPLGHLIVRRFLRKKEQGNG